jgi:hypothetical protein
LAVVLTLANFYHRAKAWVEEKRQTRPAGSLSDVRVLGESACADLFVTNDGGCLECGELVNTVIAVPEIKRWGDL